MTMKELPSGMSAWLLDLTVMKVGPVRPEVIVTSQASFAP